VSLKSVVAIVQVRCRKRRQPPPNADGPGSSFSSRRRQLARGLDRAHAGAVPGLRQRQLVVGPGRAADVVAADHVEPGGAVRTASARLLGDARSASPLR